MHLVQLLGAILVVVFGSLTALTAIGFVQGFLGEPGYLPHLQVVLLVVYGTLTALGFGLVRNAMRRVH